MRRKLTITALAALAAGALASPALAATDDPALVETAQSKPVTVEGDSVVGQAAITSGGRLIVRIALPNAAGVHGEDVVAETAQRIDRRYVSRPQSARLEVQLNQYHTGTVAVIGRKGAKKPNRIVYELQWSAKKPSVRVVGAHT